MEKRTKIITLLIANLTPAVLNVLFYRQGYKAGMLAILLSPISIILNFILTAKTKEMIKWDVLFAVTAGTGIQLSWQLYARNVVYDFEGKMVTDLGFTIWFVVSMLFFLGTLIFSFRRHHKKKQAVITSILLLLFVLACGILVFLVVTISTNAVSRSINENLYLLSPLPHGIIFL